MDGYTIVRPLGSGGMAEVLLVDRGTGERLVALKRLLPAVAGDARCREQLLTEGRRLAQLAAVPGVVDVVDVVDDPVPQRAHLLLEFVDGRDLAFHQQAWCSARQRMPLDLALGTVRELATILEGVHGARDPSGEPMSLVHRDLCPANLLVADRLTLIDLGVASGRWPATEPPRADQGRAAYMAPEQLRGLAVDATADVFSAGVILFELVTGTRLYGTADRLAVMAQIMDGVEHRPTSRWRQCPGDVEEVIMRALARDPLDRPVDAVELGADVDACIMRYGGAPAATLRSRY